MSSDLDTLTGKVAAVSESYARKCGLTRDADWYVHKMQEELGELVAEYLRLTGRGRMKGLDPDGARVAMEDEAADVLAQVLLFARHNGIDLEAALERKWFRYLPDGGG